jgi:Na+-translocating ferredoxin:NAD+ oxidoreductase RnfC subunit
MTGIPREEILQRIQNAGVVGAGGGGFPTHAKLSHRVETLIANGAECEPLVRADQQQMASHPEELVRGLLLSMNACGASEGVIAIKEKYHDAEQALRRQLAQQKTKDRVRIHFLPDIYPAGDEFVLAREVSGKIIPEFGLPLDVGLMVCNVSTLIDVTRAVDRKEPVTHRHVTVAGLVKRPSTLRVPIGTPLKSLVESAGGALGPNTTCIVGGPMMGRLAEDPELSVSKTTNMVLVLPDDHPVVLRRQLDLRRQIHLTRAACLKCMMCTEVCPRNLLGHRLFPDRLMRNVAAGVAEDPESFLGAYLCSECGLCATYGCVMGLDPSAMNREMKRRLSAAGLKRPESNVRPERVFGRLRGVPSSRLMARLGLAPYDVPAPFNTSEVPVRRLRVLMKQHAGAPALPVVKKGQLVRANDLLGEIPDGSLGARVHAGAPGIVSSVSDEAVDLEVS